MTRPPAFQFYVADFMYGSRLLTLDERGAYITLLCHQWDKGSVPGDDLIALAKVLGCSRQQAHELWQTLSEKFPREKRGFQNKRLENERLKQRRYSRKMAQNGRKGGRPPRKAAAFPRLSIGFSETKAEKSSSSSSSSSEVRTDPPNPHAARGGRVTRQERQWAETVLKQARSDPHTPACPNRHVCIGRLVAQKRSDEQAGLYRQTH
jgi:uncharacterized protein YdaU (DUF1376 family)